MGNIWSKLYHMALGKKDSEADKEKKKLAISEENEVPKQSLKSDSKEVQATSAEQESSSVSVRKVPKPRSTYPKRVDYDVEREKLWEKIQTYMTEKSPYVNPDFDRSKLAQAMYSNITYVSAAINAHGKNFSAWLAEYRINVAISILQSNPKIAVRELCCKVGILNPAVFNRQFRNVTGKSVSDYRESKA